MTERRFQDIWKEQCQAAHGVREQHGVVSALDYLIGEKLMTYAETAVTRPEFARELPRFVAEIRSIFGAEEILVHRYVADPVQAVLDRPVISGQLEQPRGSRLGGSEAGDDIGDLDADLVADTA